MQQGGGLPSESIAWQAARLSDTIAFTRRKAC
jgi:hypothetical protein